MNYWERCYTKDHCPYYVNQKTGSTQWEHPYFSKILQEAADYSDVIYAAYRTALKLLHIRNSLQLNTLHVERINVTFIEVLTRQNIHLNHYMTQKQLSDVITRLYHYCDTSLCQVIWTAALCSCLMFFFDAKKRGTVNTVSVVTFLTALCCDKLSNKYSFLFECLSEDDLIGPQGVCHLKKTVFIILSRLGEDKPYKKGYEGFGTSLTKDMFLKWLFSEPKFIVWLSTLHRIHSAVSAKHDARCYICKEQPITGLRYRCLQCFNVDMCFLCFTRIPSYGKHDKSHAIEEYCLPSNRLQDLKAFIAKLRNNILKSKQQRRGGNTKTNITSRRQPAIVWHDGIKSEELNSFESLSQNLSVDHTPHSSPTTERKINASAKKISAWDSSNTGSDGYTLFVTKNGTSVYADRYCPTLLQNKPYPHRLSSGTEVKDIDSLHKKKSSNSASRISKDTAKAYNNEGFHYATPVHTINLESKPHTLAYENQHTYSPTPYYNQSKFSSTSDQHHPEDDLCFYATHTPRIDADINAIKGKKADRKKPTHESNGQKSHFNSAFSEDEGVFVQCESESSSSHYTYYQEIDNMITEDGDLRADIYAKPSEGYQHSWDRRALCETYCHGTYNNSEPVPNSANSTIRGMKHTASPIIAFQV